MLTVTVPGGEFYDEETNLFETYPSVELRLEHSLVSIAKWESKWKHPFLKKEPRKTEEEILDYIRCMTITQNVDEGVYKRLSYENVAAITEYIETDQTATTFSNDGSRPTREIITAELIYYKMVAHGIPFECQKWHLSRLLALIRVCDIKANPGKKMPMHEVLSRNRKLNEARRKAGRTRG